MPSSSGRSNKSCHEWPTGSRPFTSGDAHNGCRALFNGTAGWAYVGPAGIVDPDSLPSGTFSYPYGLFNRKKGKAVGEGEGEGERRRHHDETFPAAFASSNGGGAGFGDAVAVARSARLNPARPGEALGRKSNGVRDVYLDAEDLKYLVEREAVGEQQPDDDLAGAGRGEGGSCDDRVYGREESGGSKRGRPIVLTLQAILSANSPTPPDAVAVAADDDDDDAAVTAAACGTTTTKAAAAEGLVEAENGLNGSSSACCSASGAPSFRLPPTLADGTHFPPLSFGRASAGEGEGPALFLAPPITMVRRGRRQSEHEGTGLGDSESGEVPGVSSAADGGGDGGVGGRGGVSCSEAVAAVSVAEAAAADAAAAAAAAAAAGVAAASDASSTGIGGDDGGAAAAAASRDALAVDGGGGVGGMSRIGWWLRWATKAGGADGDSSNGGAAEAATATDMGGPQGYDDRTEGSVLMTETRNDDDDDGWQVVSPPAGWAAASGTEAAPPRPTLGASPAEDDDGAGSWCELSAEEQKREEKEGGMATPTPPDAVLEVGVGVGDVDRVTGPSGLAAAVSTTTVTIKAVSNRAAPQAISPNLPRSYRDTLLAPSPSGAVEFSESKAFMTSRARAAAAAAARALAYSSTRPTLVDSEDDGGMVFLWRKAAAGEGGRAYDRMMTAAVEYEDPYHARKRLGAVAFKTKPRGKAHK